MISNRLRSAWGRLSGLAQWPSGSVGGITVASATINVSVEYGLCICYTIYTVAKYATVLTRQEQRSPDYFEPIYGAIWG